MTSTFTPNKNLEEPANGDYSGDWDVPVNANWTAIDTALGSRTHLNAVGATGVVALTSTQYTPSNITITGLLTANVNYQFPTGVGWFGSIYNNTTGAFTITFSSFDGGTTLVLPQNSRTAIVCDSTGVQLWNNAPVGAAGSNQQVQVNASGVLGASTALTFDGNNLAVKTAGAASLVASGAAGGPARALVLQTAGSNRWVVYADGTPESGGNAGSDFEIANYTDAGAYISSPIIIRRQTGNVLIFSGLTLNANSTVPSLVTTNIVEAVNIVGSGLAGTVNVYAASGGVYYPTPNATGNWTTNLSFSAGTPLNTAMSVGQSMTFAVLAAQGATPFFCNAVQIDGVLRTPKWQGGSAPTAGNANGIDVYTFTVIKTGSGTYTVLASLTQF